MNIVILTGAGISAESGLDTFRDGGGTWVQYDMLELATPEAFARDPARVHAFYNMRRATAAKAQPNAAHRALARLEADPRHQTLIVTQNVDDLHERGGARRVWHMHGALHRARCAACAHVWPAPLAMDPADACPACAAPATRPDIVWFGETTYHMDAIAAALGAADLFVAIGTSGEVYPAAGFVDLARIAGAQTLELNLTLTEISAKFDDSWLGAASAVVPDWVETLLA